MQFTAQKFGKRKKNLRQNPSEINRFLYSSSSLTLLYQYFCIRKSIAPRGLLKQYLFIGIANCI